jgi:hypothetical protein
MVSLVAMRMGITREGESGQPYGRGFSSALSPGTLTQATGWCKTDSVADSVAVSWVGRESSRGEEAQGTWGLAIGRLGNEVTWDSRRLQRQWRGRDGLPGRARGGPLTGARYLG